jgi:hypothetical protein
MSLMLTYLASMGNDWGRGSRSSEPPRLGTVRRLHGDDVEEADAAAAGEWYETERLTGQITGGARGGEPAGRAESAPSDARVVLDWRHAPTVPSPSALRRLGRRLDHRPGRRRRALASGAEPPRAVAGDAPELAAGSGAAPPCAVPEDGPAAQQLPAPAPGGPRIDLRYGAEPAAKRPERRSTSLAWPAGGRARGRRLAGWAIVSAVALGFAAVCVVAIGSELSGRAVKAHHRLAATASRPGATPSPASRTAAGAGRLLGRRGSSSRGRHDAGQARGRSQRSARAGAAKRRGVAHRGSGAPVISDVRTVDVLATTTTTIQRSAPVTASAPASPTGSDQASAPTSSSSTAQGSGRVSAAAASLATDNSLPGPGGPPAP